MTDNSELERRITDLEAAIRSLEGDIKAIAQALIDRAERSIKRAEAEIAIQENEKDLIRQRWNLFDRLAIRVERLEERFSALATALEEG